MTTDELRAKFEAWFDKEFPGLRVFVLEGRLAAVVTRDAAWKAYQAAHASRDAEVEELRKDAKRYRYIRDSHAEFVHYVGGGVHALMEGEHLDAAIDAAMQAE